MCVQACVCACIYSVAAAKAKVCCSSKEASVRVAPGRWVDQVYVSTEKKAWKPLSTLPSASLHASPPLDLCHTLPWRPQGWSKGDILPAITLCPLLVRHYYSPERRKYEHLCDLKQNLHSSDRFIKSTMHLPFKSLFSAKTSRASKNIRPKPAKKRVIYSNTWNAFE